MKTKWMFMFESEHLRFDKKINYQAEFGPEVYREFDLREHKPEIEIDPDDKPSNKTIQRGKINITILGTPEQTKTVAEYLAVTLQSQVAFNHPGFKILNSFVGSEMIPETPEEAAKLGEKRFGITMRVVEVPPESTFDPGSLGKIKHNPLLDQFNAANRREHPIDAFIGFFKILERLYGPSSRKETLEQAFTSSPELRELIAEDFQKVDGDTTRPFTDGEIDDLLRKFIQLRHEAAHLKKNQFGITYNDKRVDTEVRPYLDALRSVVARAISNDE